MTFKRSSVHLLRCTDPGFYVSGYFARVFFKYISPLSTAHLSHHAIEELAGADPKKSRKGGGGGGRRNFGESRINQRRSRSCSAENLTKR